MNRNEKKRFTIFNHFVKNINFLIENDLLKAQKNIYRCPLCLKPHKDLNSVDPLTLEDAPPKSLGGKPNTLTCKSCNNTAGTKIDFHLSERLKELDEAKFLPNSSIRVQVQIDYETFQGTLNVDENGKASMYYSNKNNNPKLLAEKVEKIPGSKISIEFLKSKVIPENLEYALLKTGYLLVFEKFGYSLIFNKCYDIIREQLQNPDIRIYPTGFWISPPYPKKMSGVYFVCDKGLECLLVLFTVNTGKSERMFGTFLPLPNTEIDKVLKKLAEKFKEENQFELELYPEKKLDYQFDLRNIKAMYSWIQRINLC